MSSLLLGVYNMKLKTKIFAILMLISTTSISYGANETIEMHNK